jgi:hypothetical protein
MLAFGACVRQASGLSACSFKWETSRHSDERALPRLSCQAHPCEPRGLPSRCCADGRSDRHIASRNVPLAVVVIDDSEDDELISLTAEAGSVPAPGYHGVWTHLATTRALAIKFNLIREENGLAPELDLSRAIRQPPQHNRSPAHGGRPASGVRWRPQRLRLSRPWRRGRRRGTACNKARCWAGATRRVRLNTPVGGTVARRPPSPRACAPNLAPSK